MLDEFAGHAVARPLAAYRTAYDRHGAVVAELHDVLGLTPREYQAWATGGVAPQNDTLINIPTMMLCCIPLFALVLKILYVRRGRYYVEHLVYALHIHSFVYVGVLVITLIGLALGEWSQTARALVAFILSITMLVQVFLSIRRVYPQSWFFSVVKFLVGGFTYLIILVLAVGITALVTILLPA